MADNPFFYTIPITAEAPAGSYAVDVSFKINNMDYITRQHIILIPTAALAFSTPAASYNAGDIININITNSGGKDGQFDIQALLKDSFNKTVFQKQETKSLAAGASDSYQLAIPSECKTETYQLVLKTTEILSNTKNEKRYTAAVNGLNASLNSYTLKANYFENELITGKSEIDAGGSIENARRF